VTSTLFWGVYVINKNTKEPFKTWQILTQLMKYDIQIELASIFDLIPGFNTYAAHDTFLLFNKDKNNQAFIKPLSARVAIENPLWKINWDTFKEILESRLKEFIQSKTSVLEFCVLIERDMDQLF
jgi:hypothetical protein